MIKTAGLPGGICPNCLLQDEGEPPPGEEAASSTDESRIAQPSSKGEPQEFFSHRYRILERLGEGGMGIVYLAEQREPVRRKVALKVMKDGGRSDEWVNRFEAERQALALMEHPNIARIFDGGKTESGSPFFVMEFVDGIPLNDFCDRQNLSVIERLQLFMKVCDGVEHAHQKGIIHRDLKPGNILVSSREKPGIPKIIDFGIAKALTMTLTENSLHTKWGTVLGTPSYSSPEQFDPNDLGIDTRADIYSLGAILYEQLVGQVPLPVQGTTSWPALREIICDQTPARPSTVLKNSSESLPSASRTRKAVGHSLYQALKGDLDWIVLKCLEKDRERRYESVRILCQDIQHHLTNQPVQARPPSRLYLASKFVKRNRAGVAIATSLTALLVGGIAAIGFTLSVEKAEKHRRETLVEMLGDMFSLRSPLGEGANDYNFEQLVIDFTPTVLQLARDDLSRGGALTERLKEIESDAELTMHPDQLLTVALDLSRTFLNEDHLLTLRLQSDMAATIRLSAGRMPQALQLLEETRLHLDVDTEDTAEAQVLADTLRWLVDIYRRTDPSLATEALQDWKRISERHFPNDAERSLDIDTSEGLVLAQQGHYWTAIEKLRATQERQRAMIQNQQLAEDSANEIGLLQALAGAQWATENPSQLQAAEGNLKEALSLAIRRYGTNHSEPIDIESNLKDLQAFMRGNGEETK